MAQLSWMVTGVRSERPIVVAPGTDDAHDAVTQVDNALDKFSGPVPGWFRALERLGYWWYGVCTVVGIALSFLLVPAEPAWKFSWGFALGFLAAPVSGPVLYYLARLQARLTGYPDTAQALADVADAARPSTPDSARHVSAVLAARPALERRVHDLAWRAAAPDAAARKELEGLWETADPDAAALQKRQVAALEAEFRADKSA
ncbi:hypothetical protein ACQFYA_05185 [Promicromonospora sp. Marseille-Q5078]